MAWAGVRLQVVGGTAAYTAVPVSDLTPAVAGLLLVAALLISGLVPWASWPARLWHRAQLGGAGVAAAVATGVKSSGGRVKASANDKGASGYQASEHVLKYYETTKV